MAEYDAFGRKKGEDTLEGLGSVSGASPPPAAAPVERTAQPAPVAPIKPSQPAASRPATPAPLNTGPQGSFDAGRAGRRVMRLMIGVVGVIVALAVIGAISDGVKKTKSTFDKLTIPTISTPSISSTPASPSSPAAEGSLLRRAPFDDALARLSRAQNSGPALTLRVDADRISGELKSPQGKLVFANATTSSTQTITTGAPAPSSLGAIPLRDIDLGAPQRIVAGLRARGTRVNYMVLAAPGGTGAGWTVFATSGRRYHADRHGRGLRALP